MADLPLVPLTAERKFMNNHKSEISKYRKRHVDFRDVVLLTFHPVDQDFGRIEFGAAVQMMVATKRITMLYHCTAEEVSVGTPRHLHMSIKFKSPVSVQGLIDLFESHGFHIDVASGTNNYDIYFKYLYVPSIKKPIETLDPSPELSRNHPLVKVTDENKRLTSTRINFESFFILVTENSIKTTDELFEYCANLESEIEKKQMACFLSRRHNDIQTDLDLINRVTGTFTRKLPSRLQLLANTTYSKCECGDTLKQNNDFILRNSEVDIGKFCTKTLEALLLGAGRGRCVGLIGPSRCGKTSVLSSIEKLFGMEYVFTTPISGTTAPLLNLPNTLVCLMNDFYFLPESRVSWYDLLLWFEGIQFKIGSPRNLSSTDVLYSGENPVFVTAGETIQMKDGTERSNNMMNERMVYFYFQNPIPKEMVKPYKKCAKCFWEWLTERAVDCEGLLLDVLPVPQLPEKKPEGVSRSVWKTIKNHHNRMAKKLDEQKKERKSAVRKAIKKHA